MQNKVVTLVVGRAEDEFFLAKITRTVSELFTLGGSLHCTAKFFARGWVEFLIIRKALISRNYTGG